MNEVLIISDNNQILESFLKLIKKKKFEKFNFSFAFSPSNTLFSNKYQDVTWINELSVSDKLEELVRNYSLIISLHCKQIFPKELVEQVRCVNVHPGFTPYNKGWYPHVFSMLNGLPAGATIHEMDSQLDNGPIIVQKQVYIDSWDDSESLYNRIIETEINLLDKYLIGIIENSLVAQPQKKGNLNYKSDYLELCEIDLKGQDTFENHISLLRALSHGDHRNAFYMDSNGNKVFLKLLLFKD